MHKRRLHGMGGNSERGIGELKLLPKGPVNVKRPETVFITCLRAEENES